MKSIFKSLTAQGGTLMLLPTIVPIIAKLFGIDIGEAEVTGIVTAATELVGFVLVIIGRFRAGGVSLTGK